MEAKNFQMEIEIAPEKKKQMKKQKSRMKKKLKKIEEKILQMEIKNRSPA